MIRLEDGLVPLEGEDLYLPCILWRSIATAEILTATSEDANFLAVNLTNPSTALKWKALTDSPQDDEYLTVDTTALGMIDGVGIAGHNFSSIGIAVSVEVDEGGSPQWVEIIAPEVPDDDGPLMFRFTPGEYVGVRVKLAAGLGVAEAAVMYVGKWFVFERGVQPFTPLPYGLVNDTLNARSESGQFLGRIITGSEQQSTAAFFGLTDSWVRETLMPEILTLYELPFFFAWAPENYPDETGYAWLTDDPAPEFDMDGLVGISFQMAGLST